MAKGRVRNTGAALKPEYMITDNQGNVRVSFEEQNSIAVIRQENNYYPFGLIAPGSTTVSEPNKNLYNGGSEWQNDFGDLPDYYNTYYRNYDPAIGRFIGVDPLAELTDSYTTYHYAGNNPIMFNDPLGDRVAKQRQNESRDDSQSGGGGGGVGSFREYNGSGHWYNGMGLPDWNSSTGSDLYRAGLEAGLTEVGGRLYQINPDGSRADVTVDRQGNFRYVVNGSATGYSQDGGSGNPIAISASGTVKTIKVDQANQGVYRISI